MPGTFVEIDRLGRDIYCETTTCVHDRGRVAGPDGNRGRSSGPGLVIRLAEAHSILAGRRIRREFVCCVTTRGLGWRFFQQQQDRVSVAVPRGRVDAWPRPPHAVFGSRVTVGEPVVAWQPANAAPDAGIQDPGSSVDSSESDSKRDRILCANTFEAVAALWRHLPTVDYAGAVPWELLSPLRTAPGGFAEPSGALFLFTKHSL